MQKLLLILWSSHAHRRIFLCGIPRCAGTAKSAARRSGSKGHPGPGMPRRATVNILRNACAHHGQMRRVPANQNTDGKAEQPTASPQQQRPAAEQAVGGWVAMWVAMSHEAGICSVCYGRNCKRFIYFKLS